MHLQHMFLTQRSWERECNLLMLKHDHGLEVDIGRNRNILLFIWHEKVTTYYTYQSVKC